MKQQFYQRGPESSNNQNTQNNFTQIMQILGCNSQSSCMAACLNPENAQKCQQLFQQFKGQNNPPSSGGDFAMAGNNGNTTTASLPACPSGTSFFDHTITDTNSITGIEPMGHMNEEHVLPDQADHLYFNMLLNGNSKILPTIVYSPGNVTLLQIVKSIRTQSQNAGLTDYVLEFSPCRSVIFVLEHIKILQSTIQNALENQTPNCQQGSLEKACTYSNLSIKLQSGEQIGIAGGPDTPNLSFDFGAADVRTPPLAFINQSSSAFTGITASSYSHAVCPLDYFNSTLKTQLYHLLTIKNAGANGIPACGTTMQDKPGTSQGNWYHQGATQQYQGLDIQATLAIVHSNLDPTQGEISAGTDLIPSSDLGAQMTFQPQNTGYINREPSQVVPDGHVYCYEGPTGRGANGNQAHVDILLTSSTSLKADYGSGDCSINPTLANPLVYIR